MSVPLLATVAAFVVLGAATQRLTGMGFALVASPLLVLALGPRLGVQLTLILGLAASLVVLVRVWRDVEWDKAFLLLIPALVGMVPGAWLAQELPAPWLAVVVGVLVLVALCAVTVSERARVFTGRSGAVAAGFLSGFMTITASVGGPAVVLYAESIRWPHAKFVATVQLYFSLLGVASVATLGWPTLDGWQWAVVASALVGGIAVGGVLARRVPPEAARRLVLVVAFLGALATVAKGLVELV